MYTEYFGLKEEPFSIAANPRFLYMSARHREALAHLLYGIRSDCGFVLLTGEVGTGKTTVCRCLLEQLPPTTDVAFILNPKVTVPELLSTVCDELHIPYPAGNQSIKVFVDAINAHLLASNAAGRSTVLLIDEAQNLSAEVLEQLRLLTNLETNERKLLQIILIGQPELDDLLARPELRQLSQRITARYHLRPLLRAEMGGYVSHRLAVAGRNETVFAPRVLGKLYRRTGGVPRLINVVCDRAMLGAYTRSRHTVNGQILDKAARELRHRGRAPGSGRMLPWALVGSGALLIGAATAAAVYYTAPRQAETPALAAAPGENATTPAERIDGLTGAEQNATAGKSVPDTGEAPSVAAAMPAAAPEPRPVRPLIEMQMRPALEAGMKLVSDRKADESVRATPRTEPATGGEALAMASEPASSADAGTQPPAAAEEPLIEQAAEDEPTAAPGWSDPTATASGTPDSAYASLLTTWGIVFWPGSIDACTQAQQQGLRCYAGVGNLGSLSGLDRPAVLTLRDPQGRAYYATLTRLGRDTATLTLGEKRASVAIRDLESRWQGEYVLLWRPPPLGFGVIRPGSQGEHVAWLSERLARLPGSDPQLRGRRVLDEEMVDAIKAFQRERGLAVDGIAGRQTLIRLNSATDTSVPRLVDTARLAGAG